tara:strand:+ start:550 stop:1182 length:633 start_codon:yes stop_codon:yes gene_type:complete
MTIYVKDGGTFRQASNIYVKDAGTWRQSDIVYVKEGNTWRVVHPESGGISPLNMPATFQRSGQAPQSFESTGISDSGGTTGPGSPSAGWGSGLTKTQDIALANGVKVTIKMIITVGPYPFGPGGSDVYLPQLRFDIPKSLANLIGTSSTAFNVRAAGAGFDVTGVAAYNDGGSNNGNVIYNLNDFTNSGSGGDRFQVGSNSVTFSGGGFS